jgi:NADH dehydrogenase
VVVGGGPTGVESAGAIAELYRAIFVKDYPGIPQEKVQIVLADPEVFAVGDIAWITDTKTGKNGAGK